VVPCYNKIILKNFIPEPQPSINHPTFFVSGVAPSQNKKKYILKNFEMFQCFILTRNRGLRQLRRPPVLRRWENQRMLSSSFITVKALLQKKM